MDLTAVPNIAYLIGIPALTLVSIGIGWGIHKAKGAQEMGELNGTVKMLLQQLELDRKTNEREHQHLDDCIHRVEKVMEKGFETLNKRMDKWDD